MGRLVESDLERFLKKSYDFIVQIVRGFVKSYDLFFYFIHSACTVSRMASRTETERLLGRLLDKDVLDIHGVADLLGISRSSVNTLIAIKEKEFPEPIFISEGKKRHPLRLWWRQDIESWSSARPSSRSSASVKSKSKRGESK
jgi:predicted DNA-binding transcriptional regulator AlpA